MSFQPLKILSGVAVMAALVLIENVAAGQATVLELAPGIGGKPGKAQCYNRDERDNECQNYGPGTEQSTVAQTVVNSQRYLVTVWMSSNVPNQNPNTNPWQLRCSSVRLDAQQGPVIEANGKLLTDPAQYVGNRPANHPKIDCNESGLCLIAFGSNTNNQATVKTYVAAVDTQCNLLNNPLANKISNDNNNNEGAPDIDYIGGDKWVGSYLSTTNNDRTVAVGLTLNASTKNVTVNYRRTVVAPANIGRPACLKQGDGVLCCAPQGNNRPPEDGMACTMLNASGQILWGGTEQDKDELVIPTTKKAYANQSDLVDLGNGQVALQAILSSGDGKDADNNNAKGSQTTRLMVLSVNTTGFTVARQHTLTTALVDQTHASLVGGAWGVSGEPAIALLTGSITGSGVAAATVFSANTMKSIGSRRLSRYTIDSGYLANIYGQNPNTQGRDFVRGINNVPNPGFGVTGGFRPDVKTFLAVGLSGRKPYAEQSERERTDKKNALFLSLVPAQTSVPQPDDVLPPAPDLDDRGQEDSPSTGNVANDKPADDGNGSSNSSSASNAGCSVSDDATTSAWLFGILFGVVALQTRRFRRSS